MILILVEWESCCHWEHELHHLQPAAANPLSTSPWPAPAQVMHAEPRHGKVWCACGRGGMGAAGWDCQGRLGPASVPA